MRFKIFWILFWVAASLSCQAQEKVNNYYSALAALDRGEDEAALTFFHDALQDGIPAKIIHHEMGKIHLKLTHISDAKTAFFKVENLHRNMASYELAVCYAIENQYDSSLIFLDRHIQSGFRKSKAEIRTDTRFNALKESSLWENFWSSNRYSNTEMSLAETNYLISQNQQEEALLIANNLLDRFKRNANAYFHRGIIYYSLNEYKYAAQDFSKALKLKPKNDEFAYHLSLTYIKVEQFKKAKKAIATARELNPLNADYLFTEAQISFKNFETQAALNLLNQYLAFFNHQPKARLLQANIFQELDKMVEAEMIVSKLIEEGLASDETYFIRGNAQFKKGNFQKAIEDYSMSIDLNPKDPITYMNRGNSKIMLYDDTGACYDFARAYSLGYKNAILAIRDYCEP